MLVNKKFGNLLVINKTNERKYGNIIWECICDCGVKCYLTTKNLKRGNIKSCGCIKNTKIYKNSVYCGEDLSNKIFGKLKVIKLSHSNKYKNRIWECQCECGSIIFRSTSSLNRKSVNIKSKSCGKCRGGDDIYNYSGFEDISGTRWCNIKNGAKVRNLEFVITKKDIWNIFEKQKHLCALTNLPVSFLDKTASVDRIKSDIGYVKDNIQIVHKDVNKMKNNFDQDYFIKICKLISNNSSNLYQI